MSNDNPRRIPIPQNKTPRMFHVMAKPTGAECNLDCTYCFFLSKDALYPGSRFRMSDALLESYIRQLMESYQGMDAYIAWQGGEPTLMGIEFFERSVELVNRYKLPGQNVFHTIQTNGTLLNADWIRFFKKNCFLVGLSMDGPQPFHDAYRLNKGGVGTFEKVLSAWQLLRSENVDVNILCTVHAANQNHPHEVYSFFRDELHAEFIQFIPIVERVTEQNLARANRGWRDSPTDPRPLYTQHGDRVTDRTVDPLSYGKFLSDIFDEWVKRDVGSVFVSSFDAALANWMGSPSLCIFQKTCGNALVLEHNGDLYACDHYVEPDYLLGNIQHTHMLDLVGSPKQQRFGEDKFTTLPEYCRKCKVLYACYGECPRNRFIKTPAGEGGLNHLCAGYKYFFTHIDQPMQIMANLLRNGQSATAVMSILASMEK